MTEAVKDSKTAPTQHQPTESALAADDLLEEFVSTDARLKSAAHTQARLSQDDAEEEESTMIAHIYKQRLRE